jgi:putative copper export protein
VNPVSTQRSGVDLCFKLFLSGDESAALEGERTSATLAASGADGPLPGRVRVEYLRTSGSSWWSLVPTVARRMGLGHALGGIGNVLLALALMCGVAAVCARAILTGLR